ncbi:hypothetical protein HT031_002318 [Scenedesmus sp. PABB004]|nr:hypothetical protein HT031_002318 [Scenedesmus sp. PABB004]
MLAARRPASAAAARGRAGALALPGRPAVARAQRRRAPAAAGGDAELSIEESFAAELAARKAADAAAAERAAAAEFDGAALMGIIKQKYGRSYDVSLAVRQYLGRSFVSLNLMWKYQEQQSFSYTPEQFKERLDYVASALVAWGVVSSVQTQLAAAKSRPRVGKAVSLMLDVPEDQAREWIAV